MASWTDEASFERIRKLSRRLGWLLALVRQLGLAARFSAEQHAEVNIEPTRSTPPLERVLDDLTVPVRYVVASREALRSRDGEQEQMRTTFDPVLARNPNLKVSAKVASNHWSILRKDSPAVAEGRARGRRSRPRGR